jgi:hypothetical protein
LPDGRLCCPWALADSFDTCTPWGGTRRRYREEEEEEDDDEDEDDEEEEEEFAGCVDGCCVATSVVRV